MKEQLFSKEQVIDLATSLGRKVTLSEVLNAFEISEDQKYYDSSHGFCGLYIEGQHYRSDNAIFYPNGDNSPANYTDVGKKARERAFAKRGEVADFPYKTKSSVRIRKISSLATQSDEDLVTIAQRTTERFNKAIDEARKIGHEFGINVTVSEQNILNLVFAKLKERRDMVTKESVEKDLQIAIGKLTRIGDYTKVTELTNLFIKEQYKEVREMLEEIL